MRTREEILGEHEWRADIAATLEVLLDIREELQKPQMTNEMCPNCVTPWKCNGPHEPELGDVTDEDLDRALDEVTKGRDPLFDKAVEVCRKKGAGKVMNTRWLVSYLGCSYAIASALFEQLQEAGIISKPERGKSAKVL